MKNGKKYNKNNHIKSYSIGILLLTNISLLSFGFSSWYSGISSPISASVDLTIGETIDRNSFFTFEGDVIPFEYIDTALVKDDIADPSYNEAYIIIPFQMDAQDNKIQAYFDSETKKIDIRTILVDNTSNHPVFEIGTITEGKLIFTSEDNTKETSTDFSNDSVITSTTTYKATNQNGIDFTIQDFSSYLTLSKVYFKVQFKIKFTYTSNFKTDIYDKLDNGAFNFSFKAGVIF